MKKDGRMKSNKGFTLVEVIISIGFLCIACGIIIQLFVASGDIRAEAVIRETAAVMASNTVEVCKISESPENIGTGIFNEDSTVYTEVDGRYVIRQFFNEDWLPPAGGENPFYFVKAVIEPAEMLPVQDGITAGLYEITVTTELVNKEDGEGVLITYNTSKYYVFEEGGDAE